MTINIVTGEDNDPRIKTYGGDRGIPAFRPENITGVAEDVTMGQPAEIAPEEEAQAVAATVVPNTPNIAGADVSYESLVLGDTPAYQLAPNLTDWYTQQYGMQNEMQQTDFNDRIERLNNLPRIPYRTQPQLRGYADPQFLNDLLSQQQQVEGNILSRQNMAAGYASTSPMPADPNHSDITLRSLPNLTPGSGAMNSRAAGTHDVGHPSGWANWRDQLTSFGRLIGSIFDRETLTNLTVGAAAPMVALDRVTDEIAERIVSGQALREPAQALGEGFLDVMGVDQQQLSNVRQSGLDLITSMAPQETGDAIQPYHFDPLRGYFGEMGTGLGGLALSALALPGNFVMGAIYSTSDIGLALAGRNPWEGYDPDDVRFVRFRQAFTGQDLGFTNFRDGSGNRYLAAIDPNAPRWQQWTMGGLGFAADTFGLGWVDNALWGAVRVGRVTAEGTLRGNGLIRSYNAANRLDRLNEIRRVAGTIPRFERSAANEVAENPFQLDEGIELFEPPPPMMVFENSDLQALGRQVEFNGRPIVPPDVQNLSNDHVAMLQNVFGGEFNRVQPAARRLPRPETPRFSEMLDDDTWTRQVDESTPDENGDWVFFQGERVVGALAPEPEMRAWEVTFTVDDAFRTSERMGARPLRELRQMADNFSQFVQEHPGLRFFASPFDSDPEQALAKMRMYERFGFRAWVPDEDGFRPWREGDEDLPIMLLGDPEGFGFTRAEVQGHTTGIAEPEDIGQVAIRIQQDLVEAAETGELPARTLDDVQAYLRAPAPDIEPTLDNALDAGRTVRQLETELTEVSDMIHETMREVAEQQPYARGHVMDEYANMTMYGLNTPEQPARRLSLDNVEQEYLDLSLQADELKALDDANNFDSALDRMDWSPRYLEPDDALMSDTTGAGLPVTVSDLTRLRRALPRLPENMRPLMQRFIDLGEFKVQTMWESATPAQRVAALDLGLDASRLRTPTIPTPLGSNVSTGSWYHGSKITMELSNVHPEFGGSANELGSGLYLTRNADDAAMYAKRGVNPTTIINPERRVSPVGNVYDVEVKVQNPLDVTQKPNSSLRRAFYQAFDEAFPAAPDVREEWMRLARNQPTEQWWLALRQAYGDARGTSIPEMDYRKFSNAVAQRLRNRGYDSLYRQSPISGETLVVLDQNGALPLRTRGITPVGDGTVKEAATYQLHADSLLHSDYRHPVTSAWMRQSLLDYQNTYAQDIVADYNETLKAGRRAAEQLLSKEAADVAMAREARDRTIANIERKAEQTALDDVGNDINIDTDNPCLS